MSVRTLGVLCAAVLVGTGCAAKKAVAPPPTPPTPAATLPSPEAREAERLAKELEESRGALEQSRAEAVRLRDQLKTARLETATAEEQYQALRREMDRALEEVLASKASLRGVHNRALAISRIAEVRVQLEGAGRRGDREVAERLRRAAELLSRADRVLEEGNYGGASYLADRAGELVGHARAVAEATAPNGEASGHIPIVPARGVEVVASANLRDGPDSTRRRVGVATPGTRLTAVGRQGDWFEVETDTGQRVWIYRPLVR
jgi:hypothetical protein